MKKRKKFEETHFKSEEKKTRNYQIGQFNARDHRYNKIKLITRVNL